MIWLFVLFLLVLLIFAGCWYAYSVAFYSPIGKRPTSNDALQADAYQEVAETLRRISSIMQRIPAEDVFIKSYDGTTLHGRYYHLKDDAPIEILFHGYRSHPFRDCSGCHALSRKMGFNSLVVDQRGIGESGGHSICFGIKERRDCLCWIQYLNKRFGPSTPIILFGMSMGAATVLMCTDLDLPANVRCIIADSPYSSPIAILEKVCADQHYPVSFCRPFLLLGAFLFGGFNPKASSATQAVSRASIPMLLIHAEADDYVPCRMSQQIAAQCASRAEVAIFPDAGHGLSYMADPIRYEMTVYDFLCTIPDIRDSIRSKYIEELHRNIRD